MAERDEATTTLSLELNGVEHQLTPTPVSSNAEHFLEGLILGDEQWIILEPGDQTRYELLLVPLLGRRASMFNWDPEHNPILVVRLVSGHPTGVAIVTELSIIEDYAPLANRNAWSQRVLYAWMGWLFQRLEEARYS